jgi:hypothetical protein
MNFDVRVLAVTAVNWKEFIDVIEPILGSPTRCIDKYGLDINSPLALVTSLKNLTTDTNPRYVANVIDGLFKHYNISLILGGNKSLITRITQIFCLNTSTIYESEGKAIVVTTASLYAWHHAMVAGCSESVSKEIRLAYNKIFILFNNTDLRNLWANYSKVKQLDDTFILKVKS